MSYNKNCVKICKFAVNPDSEIEVGQEGGGMGDKTARKEAIMDVLKDLCVPAHIKGYRYMIYAVELCMDDNAIIDNVIDKLYPNIADAFGDTSSRVQRAIRHAINVSYTNAAPEIIEQYFGKRLKKAPNSEFIATLAFRLQLR